MLAPEDPRHGTYNGYSNLKCRCEPCRKANTANAKRQRAKRWERTRMYGPPANLRHGQAGYTNHGCRCEVCLKDHTFQVNKSKSKERP